MKPITIHENSQHKIWNKYKYIVNFYDLLPYLQPNEQMLIFKEINRLKEEIVYLQTKTIFSKTFIYERDSELNN